jgi:hypothetical protein
LEKQIAGDGRAERYLAVGNPGYLDRFVGCFVVGTPGYLDCFVRCFVSDLPDIWIGLSKNA